MSEKILIDLETFDRKDRFVHFMENDNPFVSVTFEMDISPIIKYTNKHKNFYGVVNYIVMKATNSIKEFRYRFEDEKIYLYENVGVGPTFATANDGFVFGTFVYEPNLENFLAEFKKGSDFCYKNSKDYGSDEQGTIWTSCIPWLTVTSINVPTTKKNTIPQVIWDKFYKKGRKTFMHFIIAAHHSFVDGRQIAELASSLKNEINTFKKIK
ncbi:MAG: CatA-like O-acetyltransferase [Clostridia bacterium]